VHLLDLSFVYSFHRTDIVDSCYVIVTCRFYRSPMVVVALTGSKPLLRWWCGEECFSVGFHIDFTNVSVPSMQWQRFFLCTHHKLFYYANTVFFSFCTRAIRIFPSSIFIRVLLFWKSFPPINVAILRSKDTDLACFSCLRYNTVSFHKKIKILAMFRIPVQTSSRKVQA